MSIVYFIKFIRLKIQLYLSIYLSSYLSFVFWSFHLSLLLLLLYLTVFSLFGLRHVSSQQPLSRLLIRRFPIPPLLLGSPPTPS